MTTTVLRVQAVPVEQLHPWADNPRFIRRDRLDNLRDSIERDPEFMWRRPVLAREDGTIYAGNQRYRACVELGWKKIPAIVSDVGAELAQERGLRDNNAWGEWDDESLVRMVQELAIADRDAVDSIGFTETALRTILAESAAATPAPRDVIHREPSRTGDRDDDPPSELQAPLPPDGDPFEAGTIKQVVLQYPAERFATVVAQLEALRGAWGIDNNTDVATRALERYHDTNVGRDE